ncbi:MAG: tRNA pseudouridine(55) synthase TruB [Deltaproteobacteria bacterium]|jgi:tRNA pseudouridine55 synthase|nr:tRNA pseudouridine(55) synthase TruB [Deltaproteobacteria bacterium]
MSAPDHSGIILVDKPQGPTSRAVLDGLQRRLRFGALGHAGTLDPLASGLLIVLCGSARRLQDVFMESTKVYEATIRFGAVSETDDREGPVTPTGVPVPALDTASLAPMIAHFTGEIEQTPPSFSAVHVKGRRAHELARAGNKPALKPRCVTIYGLDVTAVSGDQITCTVRCSKGTYIRSLARDLGAFLGCGAHLAELRRTASGDFDAADASHPDTIAAESLSPLSVVLAGFGRIDIATDVAVRLGCGQTVDGLELPELQPAFAWYDGTPFCRLRASRGGARSDLRLCPIPNSTG